MLEDLYHMKTLLDLGFQITISKMQMVELYCKYEDFNHDNYLILEISPSQIYVKREVNL